MNRNSSLLQALLDLVARLRTPAPPPEPAPVDFSVLVPLQPRVLMIVYNPVVDSSGRRLVQTLGWNDPVRLAQEFMADIQECSGGLVNYRIVQRIDVDEIPVKIDGFQYRIADYMNNMRSGGGFHDPDTVNYLAVVERFDLLNRVARDELDEVWLFGGPFFGFYESTMAGAGAFFCNAPTVSGTEGGSRRFIIMGYNYERGVGEMLEDLGHRAESMLRVVYRNTRGAANLFERYALYNQVAPGQANVVHREMVEKLPSGFGGG